MTFPLIDAHCHLHDQRLWSPASALSCQMIQGVLSRARHAHISHVVSCATHEHDWRVLEQLMSQVTADSTLEIVPAFGVHPWWAHELDPDNLKPLRDILTRYPAASLGEIGLCKSARGKQVPVDVQVAAFRAQLELASELKRTCVLHCVGYYGKLLELLLSIGRAGKRLPPVLVLHSYSGPPDMMRSFLALPDTRVFFSLNVKQLTDPRMKKAAVCCKEVPVDALLLETDAPDQAPTAEHVEKLFSHDVEHGEIPLTLQEDSAEINEPAHLKLGLYSAAGIRDVAIDALAIAVYQNSKEAFGIGDLKSLSKPN